MYSWIVSNKYIFIIHILQLPTLTALKMSTFFLSSLFFHPLPMSHFLISLLFNLFLFIYIYLLIIFRQGLSNYLRLSWDLSMLSRLVQHHFVIQAVLESTIFLCQVLHCSCGRYSPPYPPTILSFREEFQSKNEFLSNIVETLLQSYACYTVYLLNQLSLFL